MCRVVCLFVRLFVCSFVRLSVCLSWFGLFVCLSCLMVRFVCLFRFARLFGLFVRSFVRSFVRLCVCVYVC